MMGHNICFYEEILIIISKLSLLLLLIWSPDGPNNATPILFENGGNNSMEYRVQCLSTCACEYWTDVH